MNIRYKKFAPVLLLLVLSVYIFYQPALISASFIRHIIYLPPFLAILAAGLAIQFNRSSIFFFVVLVIITYFALSYHWLQPGLSYGLLASLLPALVLLFAVIAERSILSWRVVPVILALLALVSISIWRVDLVPTWLHDLALSHWLPPRYFDWTALPQTAVLAAMGVFLCLLVLAFVYQSTRIISGLGIMLLLVMMMHFSNDIRGQVLFSSTALLVCLYAITQDSWRMAYLDELTELPARRALREKFRDIGGLYTVAMMDVDHFKKFNDTYGHDVGDEVLRMIASRLKQVTGSGMVYRFGGEEFTVVFNGKDGKESKTHLDALREDIADSPFIIHRQERRGNGKNLGRKNKKSVRVTVSIGYADSTKKNNGSSKKSNKDPWEVLKSADKALYRAKKKGRNRVCS